MKKFALLFLSSYFLHLTSTGQADRWQQRIKYTMDVNMNVTTNIIKGKQAITYTNNSPDTLYRIFIHLFWNAFKPNSMMDINSRSTENLILGTDINGKPVKDFDSRFKKRIVEMTPAEEGWCHVIKFLSNGRLQKTKLHETILEVDLDKPILPRSSAVFNTEFECQVPLLSRRSGRDSKEGIRYSIGQWYPKIVEYDYEGWHADDYISREFYGVWGDYDVAITINKNYKLGATGVLQNAAAIGWGYDKEGTPLKPIEANERTWNFSAKNVHDFVWAADPGYKHITRQTANGPLLHFIYKDDPATEVKFLTTADSCFMIYPFMAKTFGPYPYPVYSFIQGGGGGTEYPMATLIKNGGFETAVHEWCHSWYQMMLGTNENLYAWMDEGFADYAEAKVLAWLRKKDFFEGADEYNRYFNLARSRFDEPMSTHANWYSTNLAYNTNSYYKGAVFLRQLGYIVGENNMDKILLEYYKEWRFKHPNPNDFVRVAEKVSNMQLKWYKEYMLNTLKTVDYGIDSLWEVNGVSKIRLKRVGEMPMPIDLELKFKDGTTEQHYIPLNLMFGEKPAENYSQRVVHEEWPWTNPTYIVEFNHKLTDLREAEIDPSQRMADVERKNNLLQLKW
ncbi:MAG: M1 family metallopeptidase [Bacteroidota bacterium]|nr:M1 family metallopeptidase [Bacteroidota bacterium]